jgi:hypothetical protein
MNDGHSKMMLLAGIAAGVVFLGVTAVAVAATALLSTHPAS